MNPTNTTPGDSSDHPAGGPLPAVLVVDDIEANLVAMKRVLKDLDISISTAQSGPDALALVIRQEFAVVLLDVRMPGMDGYETAEAIFLANPAAPPPIIFVTADDRSEERMLQGYESGAIDFLYKPIQERLLRSKVRILTDLHRQRQELKLMTLALSEANRRATSLLEAASEGIVGVDPDGVITFANPAAGALLKTQADRLRGMPMQRFIAASELIPEDRPWVETPLAEAVVLEGSARDRNTTLRGADNRPFPVEMGATTISDAGHVSEFVLAFHDISDQVRITDELRKRAEHDVLTGLSNRAAMRKALDAELADIENRSNFALIYIDLNKFKPVNDQYGHEIGDQVLKVVAKRLTNSLRKCDLVARLGGDEFAVLARSVGRSGVIEGIADQIITALDQPITIGETSIRIGSALGVVQASGSYSDADDLLRSADSAMYEAKRSGDGQSHWALANPSTPTSPDH